MLRIFLLCVFLSLPSFSPVSFARSGGGHTSSSGHSSGGGSYGGSHSGYGGGYVGGGYGDGYSGSDEPFNPVIFILALLFTGFLVICIRRAKRNAGEDRAAELLHRAKMENQSGGDSESSSFQAEEIQKIDPHFSIPAFLDFVYSLYGMIHKMRGEKRINELSAYLAPGPMKQLEALSPLVNEVKGIVISSLRLKSSSEQNDDLTVEVQFTANYTEVVSGKADQSYYSEEIFLFQKKKSTVSLIPSKMRVISCPNCGAPPAFSSDGKCSACGAIISRGDFNWSLEEITGSRVQTPPLLTETVEEEGTDLPTLFAPDLTQKEIAFAAKYPDFKFSQFKARASEAYFASQKAWTERKWELVRPYESENIFQMHQYWMNEYQKQGLVNVLKDVQLLNIEAVKLETDAFFESMTVRMYGSMIDYTMDEKTNRTVAGDSSSTRDFTEYWTFIRSANYSGNKKFDTGCPACGAPLKISQAGHCEYCKALVTSGEFDWVLSQIEQDESYQG
jgi:predicted lipid-binding transport protein (Tim44 family)